MSNEFEFLEELNKTQREVCVNEANCILTACPGSGKTRTVTYRLAYLAKKYKASKKLNIAITYTNRAANEIENRIEDMQVDLSNIWTGTIHQFCMSFIIRPYALYHEKLSKGYRIIDEYVKEEYVKNIAVEMNIKYSYISELYGNAKVMKAYLGLLEKNREMDFNLILEYSKQLLEQNQFISENIGALIRTIHVDEYQDTNELQYFILSELIQANIKINIMFVGDINQAIYRNLGGVAKTKTQLEKLFPVVFEEKCLNECYRSTQRMIDYYSNYEMEKTGANSVADYREEKGKIKIDQTINVDDLPNSIAQIVNSEITDGLKEEEICIVAPQWYQIYPIANKLRQLLPQNNFDAPDISPIKYDPLNVFFLISKIIFTRKSNHRMQRRREAKEIIDILKEDYLCQIQDEIDRLVVLKVLNSVEYIDENGIETLKKGVNCLFEKMNISMEGNLKKTYDQFLEKIDSRVKKNILPYDCNAMIKCFKEKKGIVISSIHGVKGEEYTTVIGYDLLNGHLPNWNYFYELRAFKESDTKKMLYVMCSRARKNLYLFAESGRTTRKGNPLVITDELSECSFIYDV